MDGCNHVILYIVELNDHFKKKLVALLDGLDHRFNIIFINDNMLTQYHLDGMDYMENDQKPTIIWNRLSPSLEYYKFEKNIGFITSFLETFNGPRLINSINSYYMDTNKLRANHILSRNLVRVPPTLATCDIVSNMTDLIKKKNCENLFLNTFVYCKPLKGGSARGVVVIEPQSNVSTLSSRITCAISSGSEYIVQACPPNLENDYQFRIEFVGVRVDTPVADALVYILVADRGKNHEDLNYCPCSSRKYHSVLLDMDSLYEYGAMNIQRQFENIYASLVEVGSNICSVEFLIEEGGLMSVFDINFCNTNVSPDVEAHTGNLWLKKFKSFVMSLV